MENEKALQPKIDYHLLFILFLLAIVSAIAIDSAQPSLPAKLQNINFASKQLMWYGIGAVVIALTMLIDYDRLFQIAWYLYGFGMLLLLGLEFNAPGTLTIKGAKSWYAIPGIGNFQPSELMKIFLIIVISRIIVNHREKYVEPTIEDDFKLLGKIALATLPPLVLLAKQPDMGMSMVFTAIVGSLVLVSGIRFRIIFGIILAGVVSVAILVFIFFKFPNFFHEYILEDYQLNRFYGWLAPYEYSNEQGFQLIRSLLAIGSGELYGKGYKNLDVYLPEAHTDFIFGIIAEQFGFIGSSIVISLFFLLIYRMIHIALESHDPFGSYLCAGVIGMITFQVFQNIGMTIGLLPITGLPLPFISYGGSSLATYMLAIGLVLNVRSRTKKFMFSSEE
ncbi:rod shape-determining protein RodA [Thermolongibacillus altinsuensis]|jgi:rod shape determining protein RodA|uniref:Rod shape-determining protein RodA n=1 Tax=Thermolongibacillus altinsuensis TaxID=575256 RepID=A0A4R1QEZ3_9BACL|nr:FtsW/RodA/SpoVE family cell cycle protein [Thermolongibacillus altinsuensis]TCL50993.1 rod shape-determining protein RodA [Thermolongibacillus altinsuensis]GMB08937.1 cell division protein FtsW [Thermolongibacillus altinsuensis]